MTAIDTFRYYISNKKNPVNEEAEAWSSFLPTNRHLDPTVENNAQALVTCGDYFKAIRQFLTEDDFQTVIHGIRAGYEKNVTAEDIKTIHVILIKHGEFYHPAKIEVDALYGDTYAFVINVAISENGTELIGEEYTNLNSFDLLFPYSYLPKVFDFAWIPISGNRELPMFLAEWCDGYNEFHLTSMQGSRDIGIVVWDDENGNYFLEPEQAISLYRQVAAILACYYNFSSSYHISMWHHAAGDFVVRREKDDLDVKLITVRRYTPLIDMENPDMWAALETLFIFFLNLSIRIRLDRLDGVKETVWAGELAVKGTVEGFLVGLQHQVVAELIPEELFDGVKMYLKTFSDINILDWCNRVVNQVYKVSPDLDLILSNLDSHAHNLHYYIAQCLAESNPSE